MLCKVIFHSNQRQKHKINNDGYVIGNDVKIMNNILVNIFYLHTDNEIVIVVVASATTTRHTSERSPKGYENIGKVDLRPRSA